MRQLKITKSITNRESQSLEKYLQEIGREELITAEEEVRLARKIKEGDQNALDRLTKANLRFVVSVAKQYQNQGLSLPDLINEGNLGLIKAAKLFDETKEFRFISYAVWWVRQSILQALSEQSRLIKLPSNKIRILSKIQKCTLQLEHQLGRSPTAEEKADAMAVEISVIDDNAQIPLSPLSLDAPLRSNEETNLADFLAIENGNDPDEFIHDMQLRNVIEDILHTLNHKEKNVI